MSDEGVVGPFVCYDEQGNITQWGRQELAFTRGLKAKGELILEGEGGPEHFVDVRTGRILPRGRNPAMLDGLTLSSLPRPSTVKIGRPQRIASMTLTCEDGRVELSFPYPGTYWVEISSVKHLPKRFEVTA